MAMETRLRKSDAITGFKVPNTWLDVHEKAFGKLAKEAQLPEEYLTVGAAESLVQSCVDEALSGAVDDCVWSCELLKWEPQGGRLDATETR